MIIEKEREKHIHPMRHTQTHTCIFIQFSQLIVLHKFYEKKTTTMNGDL